MGLKVDVMSYLYNRTSVIEEEYLAKSAYMRYHRVDEVDYLELIIAKARKDLINEISKDLQHLLKLP